MEPRQATALLYGLQIASSNLARMTSNPSPSKVVLSAEPTSDGQFLAVYEITDEPPPNLTWDPVEEDEEEDQEQEGDDALIERWIDPRSR
jgi:hypothetical protein